TQQNAALVEEGAAAAASFEREAARLIDVVSAFKLDRAADRDAAVALVKRAIAHFRNVGPERAFRDIQDPRGPFVEGERYVVVWDTSGTMVASPSSHNVGRNIIDLADADGRKYIREIVETARAKDQGWCDYRWKNPATGALEPKSTYFQRVGEYVFGCGIYRPEAERAPVPAPQAQE